MRRLTVESLRSARLALEPLRVHHAEEAAAAFADVALHTFTGGSPADAAQLRARYERQTVGHSPNGSQLWLNWMLRRLDGGELIGSVQATVTNLGDEPPQAEVAWVVAVPYQGLGYAKEAAGSMVVWLRRHGVEQIVAHVHADHAASAGVARSIGLEPTGTIVDGEERWTLRRLR